MSSLTLVILLTALASHAMAISVVDKQQIFPVHTEHSSLRKTTDLKNVSDLVESSHRDNGNSELKSVNPTSKEYRLKSIIARKVSSQLKSSHSVNNESQSASTAPATAGAQQRFVIFANRRSRPSTDARDGVRNLTHRDVEIHQPHFVHELQAADSASAFSRTLIALLSSLHLIDTTASTPSHLPAESKTISISTKLPENKPGLNKHFGIAEGAAAVLALLAAVGAGLAALIAFVIPPLQITNQVLAVIAIALFVAYFIEDKHYIPKEYVEEDYYEDYDGLNLEGYHMNAGYVPNFPSTYGSNYNSGHSESYQGYQQPDRGKYQSFNNHTTSTKSGLSSYNHGYNRKSSSHHFIVPDVKVFDESTTHDSKHLLSRKRTISLTQDEVLPSNQEPTLHRSVYAPPVKNISDYSDQTNPNADEDTVSATENPHDSSNSNVVSLDASFIVRSRQGEHSEIDTEETTTQDTDFTEQQSDSSHFASMEIMADKTNEIEEPTADIGTTTDSKDPMPLPNTMPRSYTSPIHHFGQLGRPRSLWHRSHVPRSVLFDISSRAKTAISKFHSRYDQ